MLPTGPGYLFGLSALAMLLTATNYSNGLAYGYSFLLIAISIVSMLFTQRNLQGLSISTSNPHPVFAGDIARFPIIISSPDSITRLVLWLENDTYPNEFNVSSRETVHRSISIRAHKRGKITIPAVRLASRYPLGIFFAWSRRMHLKNDCVVFPRPAPPLPFPTDVVGDMERIGPLKLNSEDFYGFHKYQPGDSYRRIHWKSLAKTGSLHVKEFLGVQKDEVWFDLAKTPGPGLELQLSQMCRWIVDANNQNICYGIRIGAMTIAPDLGIAHRNRCLNLLAIYPDTHNDKIKR